MIRAFPALAITGVAFRYPGIEDLEGLSKCMTTGGNDSLGDGLAETNASYASFGIPPIYRASINRVQLDLLPLAKAALEDAGIHNGGIVPDRTDVIFCTSLALNRSIENHARFAGLELAESASKDLGSSERERFVCAARKYLNEAFTATSHDKVGEMASTVAARVAASFKLRGRAFAIEADDCSAIQALLAARDALASGSSDAVLVLAAQRMESPGTRHLVEQLVGEEAATFLTEGACAVVLQSSCKPCQRPLAWLNDVQLSASREEPAWAAAAQGVEAHDGDEEGLVIGGGASTPPSGIKGPTDKCIYASRITGFGHAMEGLTLLILGAIRSTQSLPGKVTAIASASRGRTYLLRLAQQPTDLHTPGDVESAPGNDPYSHDSIAVLAYGASIGNTSGTSEYWSALRSGQAQFRAIKDARYQRTLFGVKANDPALGYYIDKASFSNFEGFDVAQRMALAAAQDARDNFLLRHDSLSALSKARVLVVTATNLTSPEVRRRQTAHLANVIQSALVKATDEAADDPHQAHCLTQAVNDTCDRFRLTADTPYDPAATSPSAMGESIAQSLGLSVDEWVAMESACAGSILAIDLAVNALRTGRCDIAIVAGAEAPVNIHDLSLCSSQRMLAEDQIATFTEAASGFTPGDGAGVVVLCRSSLAKSRSLHPTAFLRSVGICTESKSVIAPNEDGQVRSMVRAFEGVEFSPKEIDFVETHGTGTLIGDEVEIRSLSIAYGDRDIEAPLPLGALKSQFGHCFSAAGIASVIKTLLSLEHKEIPPNHYEHPIKGSLELQSRGFDPLYRARDWHPRPSRVRRAAINAFGTGGINAHLLLEEAQEASS